VFDGNSYVLNFKVFNLNFQHYTFHPNFAIEAGESLLAYHGNNPLPSPLLLKKVLYGEEDMLLEFKIYICIVHCSYKTPHF